MSRLQHELADSLRRDQAHAWNILTAAAPRLSAAEILEARLREAGFAASARGHLDEQGCVALVFTQGNRDNVLRMLEAHAVTYEPVSSVDTDHLKVHTYAVFVCGEELSLAVAEPLAPAAPQ